MVLLVLDHCEYGSANGTVSTTVLMDTVFASVATYAETYSTPHIPVSQGYGQESSCYGLVSELTLFLWMLFFPC